MWCSLRLPSYPFELANTSAGNSQVQTQFQLAESARWGYRNLDPHPIPNQFRSSTQPRDLTTCFSTTSIKQVDSQIPTSRPHCPDYQMPREPSTPTAVLFHRRRTATRYRQPPRASARAPPRPTPRIPASGAASSPGPCCPHCSPRIQKPSLGSASRLLLLLLQ